MKLRFITVKLKDLIFVLTATLIAIITIVILLGIIADAKSNLPAHLAIIIDDFGQARGGVVEMLQIDRKLTCAVMPMLEYSEDDMNKSIAAGHEVIIHIPLQNSRKDNTSWVGENAIKTSYNDKQIRDQICAFMDNLPLAVGANIHMGVLGCTDKRVMMCIMNTLSERGLFFIDSRTNSKSVCRLVAKDVEIPFSENDVFLENMGKDDESIKKQLIHAAKTAKKSGNAFAIGHVGGEGGNVTAQVIRDNIKVIEGMGVEFVYASEIID